jgi:hypothetical protein
MPFNKILIALMCVVSAMAPAWAGAAPAKHNVVSVEPGIDYIVPADSPFKFAKLEPEFLGAKFDGRTTISGRYYYGQLDNYPGNDMIGLYFIPDAADAKRLPRWAEDKAVREMILDNSKAFIKAVIPAKVARAVERGHRRSAQGRVTIVAEGYEAVVSCGASIYVTKFISVVKAAKLYAARQTVERTTC